MQSPPTPESEQALAQLKAEALRMRRASSGNSQPSEGGRQADAGTPQSELTFQEVDPFANPPWKVCVSTDESRLLAAQQSCTNWH